MRKYQYFYGLRLVRAPFNVWAIYLRLHVLNRFVAASILRISEPTSCGELAMKKVDHLTPPWVLYLLSFALCSSG